MPEDFEREHNSVLAEAALIYRQKSQVRGQMWLDFPPSDKIRELHERVSRIENCYTNLSETLSDPSHQVYVAAIEEDALDLINYAVFLVKQIRRGQRG